MDDTTAKWNRTSDYSINAGDWDNECEHNFGCGNDGEWFNEVDALSKGEGLAKGWSKGKGYRCLQV